MKPQYFASTLFVATLLLTSCGHHQKKKSPEAGMPVTQSISAKGVEHLISNWPEASKKAANSMIKKYGLPHDYTDMSLIWHESGPFKRFMVYREEVPHNFPLPHTDVLQQWVNYKVPLSKVDDLWQFDGLSLIHISEP